MFLRLYNIGVMKKKERMIDEEKFVPTLERWADFYAKWRESLAKSLGKCASPADCEDAVHQAFLKVMGLSPNLKLDKELEPKTTGKWYGFMKWQARGVLSNIHGKASKFEPLPDDIPCGGFSSRMDRSFLRRAVRVAAWEACRKRSNAVAKYRAFVLFVLEERSAAEVVEAVPETLNVNNLYQICDRIRHDLDVVSRKPDSILAKLRCA